MAMHDIFTLLYMAMMLDNYEVCLIYDDDHVENDDDDDAMVIYADTNSCGRNMACGLLVIINGGSS